MKVYDIGEYLTVYISIDYWALPFCIQWSRFKPSKWVSLGILCFELQYHTSSK